MIYTSLTNKAMQTAYNAHHGQYDCNGVPYIFHPYHLAEQMDDEITLEQLEKDFPKEVTEALKLLTHSDDTDYFEYVRAIKSNPIAKAVKMADLLHNSDQSRITDKNVVSDEKIEYWNNKYTKARQILEE